MQHSRCVFFHRISEGNSALPKILSKLEYNVVNGQIDHLANHSEQFVAIILEDDANGGALDFINSLERIRDCILKIPVFVITMKRNKELYLRESSNSGAQIETFGKPIDISLLRSRLSTACKSKDNLSYIQKVETLSLLSETAAGIAHEIKNPLMIIGGSIGIIRDWLNTENREKIPDLLDKCEKAILRVDKIVANMQSSIVGINKEEKNVLVEEIINELTEFVEDNLIKQKIKFSIQNSIPKNKYRVYCNLVKMAQSIANLIKNASDEIANSKEPWIKLVVREEADKLIFEVIDSGKGIDPEVAKSIFNNFFTTKEERNGTGMGLNISKKFIEQAGGEISLVEDSENTCFRVILDKKAA